MSTVISVNRNESGIVSGGDYSVNQVQIMDDQKEYDINWETLHNEINM